MPSRTQVANDAIVASTSAVLAALRATSTRQDLAALMQAITLDMGFEFYALIHHDDLRTSPTDKVDIKHYPASVTERLIDQGRLRRDPVVRGCLHSATAFMWSDLEKIIRLDRKDRDSLAFGAQSGLNEGITVPYTRLGSPMGSCTFAGTIVPELASRYIGAAQMIGIFAFQTALRFVEPQPEIAPLPRLHPRPRDCVVLAGQGLSNKEIARRLALTPRTVDGYLTEARRLFRAHDRTELVISAVLAGEVDLHELRRRQPEHSLGL